MNDKTTDIKKIGWAEIELSNESLKNLNNLINYRDTILNNKKVQLINDNDFHNEVIKSTIRSVLRYSNQSRLFVKSLMGDLVKHNEVIKDFYLTPPYIIIHYPHDYNEKGNFHSDTLKYCKKSFTSWTPLNNYKMTYSALSILNSSHSSCIKIIYRLLDKIKLSQKISQVLKFFLIKQFDIIAKENFTYLWHSDLIHKGNFNISDKIHMALVTRITEKPLYYEPTVKISKIIDDKNLLAKENEVTFDDLSSKIFEICEIAKKNIDLINYASQLKEAINENFLKQLSFSLSIIAQRFQNNFSSNLDLISFLLAKENLVSLERFLIKFKNQDISKDIIKKIYEDKNLSYQETMIIKKFKNQSLKEAAYQKKIEWLD